MNDFLRRENKVFINEWVKEEEENKEGRKVFLQTIRLIKPSATRKSTMVIPTLNFSRLLSGRRS